MALAQKGHEISRPSDLVKDPLVLEFAGLRQDERFRESDLEQALISKLQQFLLELGKGFAFMGRQQRITLDGDHFFIDLVFYNRLTRSFVLLDLKVGKLTHQDPGQMQMYVSVSGNDPDTNNPRAPAWAWGYSKQDGKSFLLEMIVMSEDFSDPELSHR